ncbi:hypothetical protein ACFUTV_04305 [Streptomyces sp. NPDC057298]|uniref:hypothetical protein n=1 Tax=Streptomyces sp. NPDC057298 TaxID=3346091 RepID=UPI00362AABFC
MSTTVGRDEGGGHMRRSEDEILAEELGALAASTGAAGGLTRLVARWMKKNLHEIDLIVPLPFEDAVQRVVEVLVREGRAADVPIADAVRDRQPIRVVVGAGYGGMNPVVVTALVTPGDEGGSGVSIRAAAKEGLVKQRAGEKTADRLAALLRT